jgi:alkylation response protein AidB-like acyl-CoA dehydrogenase
VSVEPKTIEVERTAVPTGGFMATEREATERLLPGIEAALAERSLMELEQPNGAAVAIFREHGAPGLLVPAEYGGAGATAVEAVRVQRVLGSVAPSIAVGSTMHHLSVAGFVAFLTHHAAADAPEWEMIRQIAANGLLVASASAEGRMGESQLRPTVEAQRRGASFVISGSKKPVSLSTSMNLLTASVVMRSDRPDEDGQTAMAIVPAGTPGMTVRKFWDSPILAAAESDEVVLEDVEVPEDLVLPTGDAEGEPGAMDAMQKTAFLWFELTVTAPYIGMASALVERVLERSDLDELELANVASDLESSMIALEGVAATIDGTATDDQLARALFVRYATEGALRRTVPVLVERISGLPFIKGPEIAYLLSACHVLPFHPRGRTRMARTLVDHLRGSGFRSGDF